MYRIAIPKGSLLNDSKAFLEKSGISFEWSDRKLLFETNVKDTQVLIVRPKDVAVYVEKGAADIGIVGSDVLEEHRYKTVTLRDLDYGHCTMVVAVPKDSKIKNLSSIPDYCKVATKFPNLARKFFGEQGIPIEIIELYGSIEIAPLTDLSEIIVDLVGTGKTLKENGLTQIETISRHSARLIANRVSWQLYHDRIMNFLNI